MWYTDQNNSYIGRLDPTTGSITDIATPTSGSGPHGIDVAPDGFVYYTSLTPADTKKLSQSLDALAEPLSKVASNVVAN